MCKKSIKDRDRFKRCNVLNKDLNVRCIKKKDCHDIHQYGKIIWINQEKINNEYFERFGG